jgi:hypothetical protein
VVHQNDGVLHPRLSNCQEFAASNEFSEHSLRETGEAQHRAVTENLRSGALDAGVWSAVERARTGVSEAQLLNRRSWLSARPVSLDVEILRRAERRPATGAQVEAAAERALQDARQTATSHPEGRVRIEHLLPQLGNGDMALVILALTYSGEDEICFAMRSRPETPPAVPPQ